MQLLHALRLDTAACSGQAISLVGAGGKSTAIFKIAREMVNGGVGTVRITTTTHLGAWQIENVDQHIILGCSEELPALDELQGVVLITGKVIGERMAALEPNTIRRLHEKCRGEGIPLLVEADGAKMRPLKAPAAHEPPIPEFCDLVIVVAGLSALGRPLDQDHVHRAELFSKISRLQLNEPITPASIAKILNHPAGGLKNIPSGARRIALLNQADTPEFQSLGGYMASDLLNEFDSVIVASLQENVFQTFEHTAAIILAAGKSSRFGQPKQLLDWRGRPFVRHVAETALLAELSPVVVVTGSEAAMVELALTGVPVIIVHNPIYAQGQSSSIRAGLAALPQNIGAALFLLADQPQIPHEVLRALIDSHTRELQPIIAPLVLGERRANPVLFDRVVFPELSNLTGDIGGRAVFRKFKVDYLPWHDDSLLLDVDKPEDYDRLKELE